MHRLTTILLSVALIFLLGCAISSASEPEQSISRNEALARLRDGNARYASGHPQEWTAGLEKREELAAGGQHPFACIVTCSDSRVPPEILFDQSLGDLFIVRLAGNVASPEAVASVEYAVEHLHVPVVVVLGHSQCGAVRAALASCQHETPGPMGQLMSHICPAVKSVRDKGFSEEELYSATINENARMAAEQLMRSSRVIDDAIQSDHVTLLSAIYDIHGGTVRWQMQLIAAAAPEKSPAAVELHASDKSAPVLEKKAESETKQAAAKPRAKKTPDESGTYARRHR